MLKQKKSSLSPWVIPIYLSLIQNNYPPFSAAICRICLAYKRIASIPRLYRPKCSPWNFPHTHLSIFTHCTRIFNIFPSRIISRCNFRPFANRLLSLPDRWSYYHWKWFCMQCALRNGDGSILFLLFSIDTSQFLGAQKCSSVSVWISPLSAVIGS